MFRKIPLFKNIVITKSFFPVSQLLSDYFKRIASIERSVSSTLLVANHHHSEIAFPTVAIVAIPLFIQSREIEPSLFLSSK